MAGPTNAKLAKEEQGPCSRGCLFVDAPRFPNLCAPLGRYWLSTRIARAGMGGGKKEKRRGRCNFKALDARRSRALAEKKFNLSPASPAASATSVTSLDIDCLKRQAGGGRRARGQFARGPRQQKTKTEWRSPLLAAPLPRLIVPHSAQSTIQTHPLSSSVPPHNLAFITSPQSPPPPAHPAQPST